MKAAKQKHFPYLSVEKPPTVPNELRDYSGSLITRIAFKRLMIKGLRTIELRTNEWADMDFDKGIWKKSRPLG
ncbi:hypothetical protein [Rosenbergiella nectarea]|uniref:hypothetical protein n=1 Tax=Rosenbergiella nectarea TaxID=988801 RepID=UPI000B843D53|nr:hypothetical protein [Rosenbergiella nectarea]